MANIIFDEKRFVNVGEVCAINLKDIHPVHLTLDSLNEENIVKFYATKESVSSDNDVTFIKYLGNGFFMDLVSDQLFMTEIFNEDDFGTDEFYMLDTASQNELTKMQQFYESIQDPKSLAEFKESFSAFVANPLVISIAESPFISINSDVAKKFASQSLEQVKSKILTVKLKAQKGLQQQYSELEETILDYYRDSKISSNHKTM